MHRALLMLLGVKFVGMNFPVKPISEDTEIKDLMAQVLDQADEIATLAEETADRARQTLLNVKNAASSNVHEHPSATGQNMDVTELRKEPAAANHS